MKFAPTSRKEWIRAGLTVVVLLAPVAALLLYFAIVVVPMPGRSFEGEVPVDDDARERADRMREVVTLLSEDIGQRDAFNVRGLERARAELVARFLHDRVTQAERLRVMRAMPLFDMSGELVRAAPLWLRR